MAVILLLHTNSANTMKVKSLPLKGLAALKSKTNSKIHLIQSNTRLVNKAIFKMVHVEITSSLVGVQTHKFKQMTLMRLIFKDKLL